MVFDARSGANETSKFPMTLLFAIMAQNPDVQAKAQQELDQYLDHRLPEFGDEPHLPYTYAVLLEILRYSFRKLSPVTAMAE